MWAALARCGAGMADFAYRLFFTRDDDLDVLQLVYVLFIAFVCRMLHTIGQAYAWKDLPTGWWATVGAILGYLAITGVPRWAAELTARKAEQAIALARAPGTTTLRQTREPDLWRDDERD